MERYLKVCFQISTSFSYNLIEFLMWQMMQFSRLFEKLRIIGNTLIFHCSKYIFYLLRHFSIADCHKPWSISKDIFKRSIECWFYPTSHELLQPLRNVQEMSKHTSTLEITVLYNHPF